jgi:hypothetical protein
MESITTKATSRACSTAATMSRTLIAEATSIGASASSRRRVGGAGEADEGDAAFDAGLVAGVDDFLGDGVPLAASLAAASPLGGNTAAGAADVAVDGLGHQKKKERSSFLKKRTKKLFSVWCVPPASDWAPTGKVFWFFFSKKNRLLCFSFMLSLAS